MKKLLTALLMTGACLMAQRAEMLGDVEGVEKWPHKVNVTTELSEDKRVLTVSIHAKDFQFGWFQHNLPDVENYAEFSGSISVQNIRDIHKEHKDPAQHHRTAGKRAVSPYREHEHNKKYGGQNNPHRRKIIREIFHYLLIVFLIKIM